MKHEEITRKIIDYAMQIHRTLGNGFQKVIYQRTLEIEFLTDGLVFAREKEMDIHYKGKVIGTRRVDFFVEESIMIELKALTKLEDVHVAQALNYFEAYNMEVGLLINFGARSLEFKRVHNHTFNKKSHNPLIMVQRKSIQRDFSPSLRAQITAPTPCKSSPGFSHVHSL